MSASNFAIACMKVCSAAEHGDVDLRNTLIREGVKFWLNGLSYKEVKQIANMEPVALGEHVTQHAVQDINNATTHTLMILQMLMTLQAKAPSFGPQPERRSSLAELHGSGCLSRLHQLTNPVI